MSETYTHKAKLDSGTIKGWLILIVPFVVTILRMSGVGLPENFESEFITNVMKITEGVIYLTGLVMVYLGRRDASKPLKGGIFSGWTK